jgi:Metallo-beta-lactamase superfamily
MHHDPTGSADSRNRDRTPHRRLLTALFFAAILPCCAPASGTDDRVTVAAKPDSVVLTWLSVTSWLLEAGDTRILFDGYVSRVDRSTVDPGGTSTTAAPPDETAVSEIRDAMLPDGRLDWILVGHAHWDHAFDTPAWARLTGARIAGAKTVCLQVTALGIPAARCTRIEGGESFVAGDNVRVRAVRWHHSGDSTANGRRLRAPLELREAPVVAANGGLRPGFLEDYPNGGGSRAWLVTIDTRRGPVRIFWSNTGNPLAWDTLIDADSAFFREQRIDLSNLEWAASPIPTRDHLARALRDEGSDSVDLWIGFGNATHVRQALSLLHPRAFTPHHWDDFWAPLRDGAGTTFPREALDVLFDSTGTRLVLTPRYFDRIVIGPRGTVVRDGTVLRDVLGVTDSVR